MKRSVTFLTVLSVSLVFIPGSANARPRPTAAVTIVSVQEECQFGYAWVDATFKANKAGDYDLWLRGDSDNPWGTFVAESDTLAAGESVVTSVDLPWPQQVDVVVTASGASINRTLASRPVAAVSSCTSW